MIKLNYIKYTSSVRLIVRVLLGIALLLPGMACDRSFTPKPTGYMRVDYPEKTYRLYDDQEFYQFEIPTYAVVEIDRGRKSEAGWVNLQIPSLNGTIHLSYKPVKDNLLAYITDSRDLVYKHTVKAQGIEDSPFIHREEKRFGMVYDLKGDVAWVNFKQKAMINGTERPSEEIRVLVKEKNNWKIAFISSIF